MRLSLSIDRHWYDIYGQSFTNYQTVRNRLAVLVSSWFCFFPASLCQNIIIKNTKFQSQNTNILFRIPSERPSKSNDNTTISIFRIRKKSVFLTNPCIFKERIGNLIFNQLKWCNDLSPTTDHIGYGTTKIETKHYKFGNAYQIEHFVTIENLIEWIEIDLVSRVSSLSFGYISDELCFYIGRFWF